MAFSDITESIDQKAHALYEAQAPKDLNDFDQAMWFRLREKARSGEAGTLNLSAKAMKCLATLDDRHLEILAKGAGVSFGLAVADFDSQRLLAEFGQANIFKDTLTTEEPLVLNYWQMLKRAIEHDSDLASQLCGVSPAIMRKLSAISLSELFVIASHVECKLTLRFSEDLIFDVKELQARRQAETGVCRLEELQDLEADLVARKSIQMLDSWVRSFGKTAADLVVRDKSDMNSWEKKAITRYLLIAGFAIDAVLPHSGQKSTAVRNMYKEMSPETRAAANKRKKRRDYKNVLCNASDLMLASIGSLCYRAYVNDDIVDVGMDIPTLSKGFKLYKAFVRELPDRSDGWRNNAMPELHALLYYITESDAAMDDCAHCKTPYYYWFDQSTFRHCPFC